MLNCLVDPHRVTIRPTDVCWQRKERQDNGVQIKFKDFGIVNSGTQRCMSRQSSDNLKKVRYIIHVHGVDNNRTIETSRVTTVKVLWEFYYYKVGYCA